MKSGCTRNLGKTVIFLLLVAITFGSSANCAYASDLLCKNRRGPGCPGIASGGLTCYNEADVCCGNPSDRTKCICVAPSKVLEKCAKCCTCRKAENEEPSCRLGADAATEDCNSLCKEKGYQGGEAGPCNLPDCVAKTAKILGTDPLVLDAAAPPVNLSK